MGICVLKDGMPHHSISSLKHNFPLLDEADSLLVVQNELELVHPVVTCPLLWRAVEFLAVKQWIAGSILVVLPL